MVKNIWNKFYLSGVFLTLFFLIQNAYALCVPGEKICADENSTQECQADGQGYLAPALCGDTQGCSQGQCIELCEIAKKDPNSLGCSFLGNSMDNLEDIFALPENDVIVAGNTSDKTASVSFFFVPEGSNTENLVEGPIDILPGQTHVFEMTNDPVNDISIKKQGGMYRIQSNIPISAYQHSPLLNVATNDAALLLPEHALRQNYIISSYAGSEFAESMDSEPSFSYFNIIGLEDNTTVKWTPTNNTMAGAGVNAVSAGNTGEVILNRYDFLQVRGEGILDLSGTIIKADKPIWVMGANECTRIPDLAQLTCNILLEQMIPIDYWGKKTVGARINQDLQNVNIQTHLWRVYAGANNVTITTDPVQPGTPVLLNYGEFAEISAPANTSFIWEGDGPFLAVQYMQSATNDNSGDPSMVQYIPVEQYLNRYAFLTGLLNDRGDDNPNNDFDYIKHVAQIIRPSGATDVLIDGLPALNYSPLNGFEFSDSIVSEGSHFISSEEPFGLVVFGLNDFMAYSFPGGLQMKTLNKPDCGDGITQPGEECDDGNQSNDDACSNTCKSLFADIKTIKIADKEKVQVGEELTYLIKTTNLGPANGVIVKIEDPLPEGTEFISVTPGNPVCTEANLLVTCLTPPLNSGDSFEAEVKVKVVSAPQDNVLINLATATPVGFGDGTGTGGDDGTGGNGGDGGDDSGLVPTDPNPENSNGKVETQVGNGTVILEGSGEIFSCSMNSSSSNSASWIQLFALSAIVGYFFKRLRVKAAK